MISSETEPIIRVKNVSKTFDNFSAVKEVSFQVNKGECFGLLGPNGAGKTSLAKMIYGFSPVSSGELTVFDLNIMTKAREIKAKIGVVAQDDNLDPELSVLENLLTYAGYFGIKKTVSRKRAEEILEFMDLTSKASEIVDHLSGGLKRRLTIARSLMNQPELLILDEPTTGLDPYARHLVWQRLRKLKDSGTTMLLTTHYLEEASQLCDKLIILYKGKIIEKGTPEELIKSHVGQDALVLGINMQFHDIFIRKAERMIKTHQILGDDLLLFTNNGKELSEFVLNTAAVENISINHHRLRPTTLEDVFLKLTGETLESNQSEKEDKRWAQ